MVALSFTTVDGASRGSEALDQPDDNIMFALLLLYSGPSVS